MFFHASEVQPLNAHADPPLASPARPGDGDALQQMQQGDEVSFIAWPPPAQGAKWVAKQVLHTLDLYCSGLTLRTLSRVKLAQPSFQICRD